MASSTTSTTSVSITSGAAPSQFRRTLTTGKSTSGSRLMPIRCELKKPKNIKADMSIQAKTGLRIERSERIMGELSGFYLKVPEKFSRLIPDGDKITLDFLKVLQGLKDLKITDEIKPVVFLLKGVISFRGFQRFFQQFFSLDGIEKARISIFDIKIGQAPGLFEGQIGLAAFCAHFLNLSKSFQPFEKKGDINADGGIPIDITGVPHALGVIISVQIDFRQKFTLGGRHLVL